MIATKPQYDPELDLVLERVVDVPPDTVWKAWTDPELLKEWFAPAPWSMADVTLDLRPGGIFHTVMRSPEGEEFPNEGCILEVVDGERLVFTDALASGYRPKPESFMSVVLTLTPEDGGTRYRVVALHGSRETRAKHEAMGFHDGWGKTLDQLVEVAKAM